MCYSVVFFFFFFFLLLIIKNSIPSCLFFHSELFCKITSLEEWILLERLAQWFFFFFFNAALTTSQSVPWLTHCLVTFWVVWSILISQSWRYQERRNYTGETESQFQIIMFEKYFILPTEFRKCRHTKTCSFVVISIVSGMLHLYSSPPSSLILFWDKDVRQACRHNLPFCFLM